MVPLPGDGVGLGDQVPKDAGADRLLPVFALAEDQVFAVWVQGGQVDLVFGVPIAAKLGEVEGPGVGGVEVPHALLAEVFIDEGDVIFHQALANFL